jgi:lipopolysaccharide biosynthesis regulator YciM
VLPLLRASVGTPQRFDRELEKLHRAGLASPWVELEMAESAYSREELEQARQLLDALVRRHPRSLHVREAHLNLLIATADERTIFAEVDRFTALALESAPGFVCGACGHRQASSFTACPRCQETGSVRYEAAASRVVAR